MVLAAAAPSPRRNIVDATAPVRASASQDSQSQASSHKEINFGFSDEFIVGDLMQFASEQRSRPLTPRELRELRRRSIQSCMDSIQSNMTGDDWTRLKRLAKQGAVHYQAEEEFMHAPMMRRSHSAPLSSLAERYERLRCSTTPSLFRRPAPLDISAASMDAVVAAVPRRSSPREPLRILVRSLDSSQSALQPMAQDTNVASPAPSPSPMLHQPDASMTDDSQLSVEHEVVRAATMPLRAKRGSDPHIELEHVKDKKKKKKRGLFHRRPRLTSESTEGSVSPPRDRSWTQRVQHYMQTLLRRR